jgi:hypothetical protein
MHIANKQMKGNLWLAEASEQKPEPESLNIDPLNSFKALCQIKPENDISGPLEDHSGRKTTCLK